MLKWAVYKKNQKAQAQTVNPQSVVPDPNSNRLYNDKSRRSLDAQVVSKNKKRSRYQRRSIGATARRNNTKNTDKENINFIGNTPNYYKAGFVKHNENVALRDVSNITPTSATPLKKFEKFLFYCDDEKDVPPELPPTTPPNSRRVTEVKKRKLEMNSSINNELFATNRSVYKSEKRIKNVECSLLCSPKLSHSTSERTLNELSNRFSANITSSKISIRLEYYRNKNKSVCTTKTLSGGLVEIEYNKDLVINCLEKPLVVDKSKIENTTLPIFGRGIFADNPLYLKTIKNNDVPISIRPLKRTRKTTNDYKNSFESPSIDKSDAHSFDRDHCSPVSVTPPVTLESLRFRAMSTHITNKRDVLINDVCQYFPKCDNPFGLTVADEDTFAEMENKFILNKKSFMSSTESTISTTQMGDTTLDQMIEDIIKSTKIVKCKRRVINNKVDTKLYVEEETPSLEALNDLFVKPQADNKFNLMNEAKFVNLPREYSVSPNNISIKKKMPIHKLDEKLSKDSLNGSFLLNVEDSYNKRKAYTPYNLVFTETAIKNNKDIKILSRYCTTNVTCTVRNNPEHKLSKSTPDFYNTSQENDVKIRRQIFIRKKKSRTSKDSLTKQKQMETDFSKSLLLRTLEMDIPSPALDLQNVTLCEPLHSPLQTYQPIVGKNEDLHNNIPVLNTFLRSSLMCHKPMSNRKIRSKEILGLNLEYEIPNPTNPAVNLKYTSKNLNEDRARETSNLEKILIPSDAGTPVYKILKYKDSKRHLKYSSEESSIKNKEKWSIASNRMEQSDRHQALKTTIDLEIKTKHKQSLAIQSSMFQETSFLYEKKEPELQWHLKLPLPTTV